MTTSSESSESTSSLGCGPEGEERAECACGVGGSSRSSVASRPLASPSSSPGEAVRRGGGGVVPRGPEAGLFLAEVALSLARARCPRSTDCTMTMAASGLRSPAVTGLGLRGVGES